jgi:DNA-binding SARP family transcriptional activator
MLMVRLFGKFCAERDRETLSHMPGGKPQELLCYLLLHREIHPRETLATLLWPDCEAPRSKKNLRQVLWQLQSALANPSGERDSQALCIDPESVQVNKHAPLRVDVEAFEEAYRLVRSVAAERVDHAQAAALHDAVLLYRGDLLEGCYQDWCLVERERLQNCYLTMLDKLIVYSEARQEYQQGIEYAERVLALDRAHERSHQHLMRLHYLSGNRTGALRQYERCKAALREELAVVPSRHSTELYEQIRADKPQLAVQPATAAADRGPSRVLFHLQQTLTFLNKVQTEIKKEIRSAQQAEKGSGRKLA